MAETGQAAEPVIRKQRGPSLVWLIPLVTLLAGGWLIAKYIAERGPEITITFKTAEGIAKKTPIKYKDVQIGTVKKIRFSEDFHHVVLTARMASTAEPFLRSGTKFWVVRPHLSLRGASGLNALLSGTYIEVDPGDGEEQYEFIGLEEPPAVTSDIDGLRVTLIADSLGSLDIGSPVYFRGMPAGKILDFEPDDAGRRVRIHAFIRKPFDQWLKPSSHFWNISGIDASVGTDGFRLHSPSLITMMFGGIAFDSPDGGAAIAAGGTPPVYRLHAHREDISEEQFAGGVRYMTYFDSSVHGLSVGAPVEFQGIRIGRVSRIGLEFRNDGKDYRIPVELEIQPARLRDEAAAKGLTDALPRLIEQGLHAQLRTASLLTGRLYIALTMHPTPQNASRTLAQGDHVIPSLPGGLDQMQSSMQNILGRLDKVLSAPAFDQSVRDLHASLKAFRHAIEQIDRHAGPVAGKLDDVLLRAREALERLNRVLDPASPVRYRFEQAEKDLSDMARAIRAFVEMLERHPDALLFGKPQTGEH